MTQPRLDVIAIGNAIVDVIADADDAFLIAQGLDKGSMRLIDADEADIRIRLNVTDVRRRDNPAVDAKRSAIGG